MKKAPNTDGIIYRINKIENPDIMMVPDLALLLIIVKVDQN